MVTGILGRGHTQTIGISFSVLLEGMGMLNFGRFRNFGELMNVLTRCRLVRIYENLNNFIYLLLLLHEYIIYLYLFIHV